MSGLPEMNYPSFHAAAEVLQKLGYETENPADNENPDAEDYMVWIRLGIAQLVRCDGVALLPGFGMSKGACLEVFIASFLKMPVRPLEEWIEVSEHAGKQRVSRRLRRDE